MSSAATGAETDFIDPSTSADNWTQVKQISYTCYTKFKIYAKKIFKNYNNSTLNITMSENR